MQDVNSEFIKLCLPTVASLMKKPNDADAFIFGVKTEHDQDSIFRDLELIHHTDDSTRVVRWIDVPFVGRFVLLSTDDIRFVFIEQDGTATQAYALLNEHWCIITSL